MPATLQENMINPQVLADMVSYELEKKLKLTGFYRVDRTLTGRPGDTITVPSWLYIGAADIVPENTEVPLREMKTEDIKYTIRKAAVDVTLTDEAILTGYGDPMGNTANQLRLSIQERMEIDGIEQLHGITAVNGLLYKTTTEAIGYDPVVEALDLLKLEEQGTDIFLMVNHKSIKTIRKDPRFAERPTNLGDDIFGTGVVGSIAGARLIISNRLTDTEAYLLTPNCLTAFLKRDVNMETQREMGFRRTRIGTDAHYVIAIEDYGKIVAMNFKAA